MATDKQTEFWTERLRKHGHTGWSDPVTYAYDQLERLSVVSTELDKLDVQPQDALDFGCGTGDFSKLLLTKGYRVWGYDPYVKPRIASDSFQYLETHRSLDHIGKFGLVLSVTVLDHILDNRVLDYELRFLRRKICGDGFLLMVEYALDKPSHSSNVYQAFRTVDVWMELLAMCEWEIVHIVPIPHPTNAPSNGYSRYSSSQIIHLARWLLRFRFLKPMILPVVTQCAGKLHQKYGVGSVHQSPLKLFLCQPD